MMTNWESLVARISKAEKNVAEWADGLRDAEKTLASVRSEMAAALGLSGVGGNGTNHAASPTSVPTVARRKTRRNGRRRDLVLALLKEKGGFVTVAETSRAHGCSSHAAGQALNRLCLEGKAKKLSRGRYALVGEVTP